LDTVLSASWSLEAPVRLALIAWTEGITVGKVLLLDVSTGLGVLAASAQLSKSLVGLTKFDEADTTISSSLVSSAVLEVSVDGTADEVHFVAFPASASVDFISVRGSCGSRWVGDWNWGSSNEISFADAFDGSFVSSSISISSWKSGIQLTKEIIE
jgi:hypothetical protein